MVSRDGGGGGGDGAEDGRGSANGASETRFRVVISTLQNFHSTRLTSDAGALSLPRSTPSSVWLTNHLFRPGFLMFQNSFYSILYVTTLLPRLPHTCTNKDGGNEPGRDAALCSHRRSFAHTSDSIMINSTPPFRQSAQAPPPGTPRTESPASCPWRTRTRAFPPRWLCSRSR